MIVDVIIPAFNEENSIGKVVKDIPIIVREIIVVNNNSTDNTVNIAKAAGATVLTESQQGYGAACLKGIAHANANIKKADVIVFLDADYSDYPEEMHLHLAEIEKGFDMVIGSRALGNSEKGSMTFPQRFGNGLATFLMKLFYKESFTDLGPFRAIKLEKLNAIGMVDTNYGWTVEMQIKAIKNGLKSCEVPVNYRKRIGISKVSGTIKGAVMAGYKIILTRFKYL